jgi:soluble epoxide hydrolase / lipid-phosphate phosphatase
MVEFDSKISKKTLKVPRGYEYTYYTAPAAANKPTVLLCHGWPDEAHLWTDVVNNHLLPAGYGVVVPDLLGYAGTSKPLERTEYALDQMAADLAAILDAESITTVVSLGHDWGSAMAQRFYNFQPSRTSGLVTLNVAYLGPLQGPFDVDAINQRTTEVFGYGTYHYWKLFGAEDGPEVLNAHPDSVYTICHTDPKNWSETFTKEGGMRDAVSSGKKYDLLPYAQGEPEKHFVERMKRDGFDGPQRWYQNFVSGNAHEVDQKIKAENTVVNVPYLFWGGREDYVCRWEMVEEAKGQGLVPNNTVIVREGGHWAFLASPEVFGKDLVGWLDQNFKA